MNNNTNINETDEKTNALGKEISAFIIIALFWHFKTENFTFAKKNK